MRNDIKFIKKIKLGEEELKYKKEEGRRKCNGKI